MTTATTATPRPYHVINPGLAPTTWTGEVWGYRSFPNRNWFNSAWLGTVWNLMTLPQRTYYDVLKPMLLGHVGQALYGLVMLPLIVLMTMFLGLIGRIVMLPYSLDVLVDALILDEDQASEAISKGMDRPVIKVT